MNALCVREEKGRDYYHIHLYSLDLDDNGHAPYRYGEDVPTLRLSCQGNNDPGDRDTRTLYAWQVCFDAELKTTEAARHVLRVLTTLEKGFPKIEEDDGAVADFADYCGRVAKILGVKVFCECTNAGCWSEQSHYRTMTRAAGIDHIRSMDRCWQQQSAALRAVA